MAVDNGGSYLEAAVESILQQTFRDFEFVIVADNALAEAIGEGYRYAAYVMQQVGRPDEAIALLRTGRGLSRGRGGLGAMLAGACSKRARAALRDGRLLAGIAWGIEALRARPPLLAQLLRRRTRDAGVGA